MEFFEVWDQEKFYLIHGFSRSGLIPENAKILYEIKEKNYYTAFQHSEKLRE